ncbi:Zinc finger C2H2-type [Trinorchestia longiramus]|nr:Zinc finger C2H2-type [Trinorchestia longiramus]
MLLLLVEFSTVFQLVLTEDEHEEQENIFVRRCLYDVVCTNRLSKVSFKCYKASAGLTSVVGGLEEAALQPVSVHTSVDLSVVKTTLNFRSRPRNIQVSFPELLLLLESYTSVVMSEFSIECALCAKCFSEESLYEQHDCGGGQAPLSIKIEDKPEEEEEEVDVKPVLNSAGEVIEAPPPPPPPSSTSGFNSTLEKFRMRLALGRTKKKKKKKPKENVATSIPRREKRSEEPNDPAKDTNYVLQNGIEVSIKAEPIELCEVVNVKDEPMDYEEIPANSRDPLGNTVEDILGLEDEDYLIENFVEYDEEMSGSLEIDDEASSDTNVSSVADYSNPESAQETPVCMRGKPISSTNNKGHACTMCDKKFFEKAMLEDHLKVSHRTPRPYACPICNKRFNHKNYVNLHMRVHTGEKPYKCNLCSRSYSHKTSYVIHMRIHKGDRPYSCGECGKKCYDKSGLTSHMRSHTKETPYQCECCGRKFTHSKSLLVHRRNHTGEKPYVCPHCGRAFRHWHKHKIHIRLHTGERPYKCTICNKGFPRNDEVKRHMRSHTGIKSFRCSICGVYCATQASITGHINLHHVNLTTDSKFLPDKTIVENSQSGILGKKAMPSRGCHRTVDTTSYEDYSTTPEVTSLPGPVPQTIVSSKPMTPQEKVNNKSMTYRQFLNDQEQELLAKGLKVVDSSIKVKEEPGDDKEANKADVMDNVFVKVPHARKSTTLQTQRPRRIILPNCVKNNNSSVVLGDAASNLMLQSVQTHKRIQPRTSTSSTGPVYIQTLGSSSPVVVQSGAQVTNQPVILTNGSTVQEPKQSSLNSSTTNSETTETSTSKASNGSILQAALTASKPAVSKSSVTESIIVLNKGMSGGGVVENSTNTNVATAPVVMLTQPVVQQQLLLLPGINGGPARLVILQPSPTTVLRPSVDPANTNNATEDTVASVKREKNTAPMVQIDQNAAPSLFMIANSTTDGAPTVKSEPIDFDAHTVKLEREDEELSEINNLLPAAGVIKTEPFE